MTEEEIKNTYTEGNKVHLLGYTSTTRDVSQAVAFALQNPKPGKVPVLLDILFQTNRGLFELSQGYSAFPEEKEILL